jgi:hypothetical protein
MLLIELKFWNYVDMKMMKYNICLQYTAGTAWHEHKMSEAAQHKYKNISNAR